MSGLLDKNGRPYYHATKDRGARFISKLLVKAAFLREWKGDIAEVESSGCAAFAGPSEKIRRTVTFSWSAIEYNLPCPGSYFVP